jgi:predicted ribosomally synthesized six-cysteine peptide SCIFF
MKHIKTIVFKSLVKDGNIGCGECQASCQSACKTSCTVGNQICKRDEKINVKTNKQSLTI